jgi:hypothetical protein
MGLPLPTGGGCGCELGPGTAEIVLAGNREAAVHTLRHLPGGPLCQLGTGSSSWKVTHLACNTSPVAPG